MNTTTTPAALAQISVSLSAKQFSELRVLVNDRQDTLFKSLHVAVSHAHENRADGLRAALVFWDEIDRELSRAGGAAFDLQHQAQADLR